MTSVCPQKVLAWVLVAAGAWVAGPVGVAQTPRPFPAPSSRVNPPQSPAERTPPDRRDPAPERDQPAPEASTRATNAPVAPTSGTGRASAASGQSSAPERRGPTAAELGVPLYPTAQFLTSYDAGRGQTFYLFGAAIGYAQMVTYYQSVLRDRGDEVFEGPATHMFEVGRFRDETMAFPPSVTIKDFGWEGSPGYRNPQAGGTPQYFPTVIQIVPPAPAR